MLLQAVKSAGDVYYASCLVCHSSSHIQYQPRFTDYHDTTSCLVYNATDLSTLTYSKYIGLSTKIKRTTAIPVANYLQENRRSSKARSAYSIPIQTNKPLPKLPPSFQSTTWHNFYSSTSFQNFKGITTFSIPRWPSYLQLKRSRHLSVRKRKRFVVAHSPHPVLTIMALSGYLLRICKMIIIAHRIVISTRNNNNHLCETKLCRRMRQCTLRACDLFDVAVCLGVSSDAVVLETSDLITAMPSLKHERVRHSLPYDDSENCQSGVVIPTQPSCFRFVIRSMISRLLLRYRFIHFFRRCLRIFRNIFLCLRHCLEHPSVKSTHLNDHVPAHCSLTGTFSVSVGVITSLVNDSLNLPCNGYGTAETDWGTSSYDSDVALALSLGMVKVSFASVMVWELGMALYEWSRYGCRRAAGCGRDFEASPTMKWENGGWLFQHPIVEIGKVAVEMIDSVRSTLYRSYLVLSIDKCHLIFKVE